MMTIEDMKALSERLYAEALRYNTISQVYHDLMDACAIIDHYVKLVESKSKLVEESKSLEEDDGE